MVGARKDKESDNVLEEEENGSIGTLGKKRRRSGTTGKIGQKSRRRNKDALITPISSLCSLFFFAYVSTWVKA